LVLEKGATGCTLSANRVFSSDPGGTPSNLRVETDDVNYPDGLILMANWVNGMIYVHSSVGGADVAPPAGMQYVSIGNRATRIFTTDITDKQLPLVANMDTENIKSS